MYKVKNRSGSSHRKDHKRNTNSLNVIIWMMTSNFFCAILFAYICLPFYLWIYPSNNFVSIGRELTAHSFFTITVYYLNPSVYLISPPLADYRLSWPVFVSHPRSTTLLPLLFPPNYIRQQRQQRSTSVCNCLSPFHLMQFASISQSLLWLAYF